MPANKTYVIGITGGTGSGKSEAARFLATLGAKHVDADAISRRLTAKNGEAIPEIRKVFGDTVFDADGALIRQALADIIFSDKDAKRALEDIIHPMIQRCLMDEIATASRENVPVTVLDVPLLFECGLDAVCDETWVISVDVRTRLERIRIRDGLSDEQAQARIMSQMPADKSKSLATRVINSDRPIEKTQAELRKIYEQLLRTLSK